MSSPFTATLLSPAKPADADWCFVILPKPVSDTLPRRGRTSVAVKLNGHDFNATLEPDGQLSHWLKVSAAMQQAAGVAPGDEVTLAISPIDAIEPELPGEFQAALAGNAAALATWQATTLLARVDWVHWMESAKQAATRSKRMTSACKQLAEGKQRVCCFDSSGYYDKSLKAPDVKQ